MKELDNIFQCQNCGRKSTAKEVDNLNATCPKCRDVVLAYTIDAARAIMELQKQSREAMNAFMQVHTHLTEVCRLADESYDAFDSDLEGFMDTIRKEAFEGMKVEVNSIKKEMNNEQ